MASWPSHYFDTLRTGRQALSASGGTRSVSGVAERVAFACACCRSETVRPQRRLYAPWKWRIPSSACPGGGRQSSRRMRCGPHGCGEHGGRRSRARRAVDAALQQWHTVRGHRLSEKSELPRKPRCQAWHAPGGQDWRPSARLAGTAWREDRAALRAGRWARTRVAKPTRARQALRQAGAVETALTGVLRTSPHPHQLATPQKLTGYAKCLDPPPALNPYFRFVLRGRHGLG